MAVPPVPPECTAVGASWCPNCGECTCADPASGSDPECPLHAPDSPHAAPPTQAESLF